MRATITVQGGADPAVAWSRYENLDLLSTWSPQISEVLAGTRRIRSGLAGLVVGPLGIRVPFEVLAVDADVMEWSWRVRLGFVHATLDHVVRPTPGGCATELVIEAPAFAVIGYRPVAALALRRLVRSEL